MFPMISSLCWISALLLNQPRRTSSSNRATWLHQKIFKNFWKKQPDIWIFHKRTVPWLRSKITEKNTSLGKWTLLNLKITLLWKGKSFEANLHDFGGKPWVLGKAALAFPFSAINKRHPTAQPTNGSFVGFRCYKKDLMQWQFWRKPPQEIRSFPWGSLSFEWPGIFYFSQWLVVLLILWFSWSWKCLFQMIYLEKCKPPASLWLIM